MNTYWNFTLPGILFLLTLIFGFWLSRAGKPYNGLLFNLYKLIALAAVVLVVVQLAKLLKGADSPALLVVLLVVASLCVVALFACGALLSLGKLDYNVMLSIHKIAPILVAASLAVTIYVLGSKL